MRVLDVRGGSGVFTGAESMLVRLATAHRAMGIEHVVLTGNDEGFLNALRRQSIPFCVHDFTDCRHRVLRRQEGLQWSGFRQVVERIRPDIVFFVKVEMLASFCLFPWLTKAPVVVRIQREVRKEDFTAEMLAGLSGARAVICISDFVRRTFEQFCPAIRAEVVPNGVDPGIDRKVTDGRRVRAALGLTDADILVSLSANFYACKRHETFIRAATELRSVANLRFVIVGGPAGKVEYYEAMKRLAADLRVPVLFAGFRKDALSYIAASDITTLCTEGEGFGIVLLEAMALSKPIVAAHSGACPEVVEDGVSGILFPLDDHRSLAANILTLARNREMRLGMGAAGRERLLKHFTLQRHAEQIAKVFQSVIVGGAPSRLERMRVIAKTAVLEVAASAAGRFTRLWKNPQTPMNSERASDA